MGKENKKPRFCDLVVTENCMLKCKMCRMWQSRKNCGELEIGDWKRFVDSLEDFVDSSAQIQFVGGEPVNRDTILDYGYSKDKRFDLKQVVVGIFMTKDGMPIRSLLSTGVALTILPALLRRILFSTFK